MERKVIKTAKNTIPLPVPSSSDLRGRQSVRATFKLTEKAINAMNIVATHLGIKQKSLFDHLIADSRALGLIAGEIRPDGFDKLDRIQKTYVISKNTLLCLGEISKKFNTPRDALVEYSVLRLLPIIAEEQEKQKKRKEILWDLNEFLKRGEELLKKCRKILGEEDPIYDKLGSAINACQNAHENIRFFVEKGNMIEDFNFEETQKSVTV